MPFLVYYTDYLARISQHSLVADIPTADVCMLIPCWATDESPPDLSATQCSLGWFCFFHNDSLRISFRTYPQAIMPDNKRRSKIMSKKIPFKDFIKDHLVRHWTDKGIEDVKSLRDINPHFDKKDEEACVLEKISGRIYLESGQIFALYYQGFGVWGVAPTNGDFIDLIVREDKDLFVLVGHDGGKDYDLGDIK